MQNSIHFAFFRPTLLSVHVMTSERNEKTVRWQCLLFTTSFNRNLHLTTIFGEQETLWFVKLILRTFLDHFLWHTVLKSNFQIRTDGQVLCHSYNLVEDAQWYSTDLISFLFDSLFLQCFFILLVLKYILLCLKSATWHLTVNNYRCTVQYAHAHSTKLFYAMTEVTI